MSFWTVPKIWEGGDVWILGGGPSLTSQFCIPEDVVNKVKFQNGSLSLYSPYLEAIHKKHTIAVNMSFYIGNWIDMLFFGDDSFFLARQEDIANFPGLKVSCHPFMENFPWIRTLQRDSKVKLGLCDDPSTVRWNYNSGAAAINVAANMGAKRIILVGFDMTLENGSKHFHNSYHNSMKPDEIKTEQCFAKHKIGFKFIAKDAQRRGIEIINASPISTITDFPKCSVKDLL